MSAGERIPSRKRFGAVVTSVVWEFSEKFDFVIGPFRFRRWFLRRTRLLGRSEVFNYGFAGALTSNAFDLLLRVGKAFLADCYQVHPFLLANDRIFEWQATGLTRPDNFRDPNHR